MRRGTTMMWLMLTLAWRVGAQDIPLYSQKLTNFFIFNPAIAGHTFGSLTYSFRQNYANVEGTPKNHFLSMHAPFVGHRMGAGVNVYQENVNFLQNTYASVATAYHLHLNRFNILSLGVSGEYNVTRLSGTSNTMAFEPDPVLTRLQNGEPTYDFSFGTHYQNRFFKVGFAMNRLASSWLAKENTSLADYYSLYAQGLIPLRGGLDILEPYASLRKFSQTNQLLDLGLFYTFNNQITAGASLRSGKVLSGSLGYRLNKKFLIGYSRETIMGGYGGFLGAANEVTLRYDFNDESYQQRFRADYKNAMSYRRKTLTSRATVSSRQSSSDRNKKSRLQLYSPNARYENNLKLSTVKMKGGKGKSAYGKKKRKSTAKRRKPTNPVRRRR